MSLVCNRLRGASHHLAFLRGQTGKEEKQSQAGLVHQDQFYCLGTGAVISKGLHCDQQLKPRWTESPFGSGQHSDRSPDPDPHPSQEHRFGKWTHITCTGSDWPNTSVCLRPPSPGLLSVLEQTNKRTSHPRAPRQLGRSLCGGSVGSSVYAGRLQLSPGRLQFCFT